MKTKLEIEEDLKEYLVEENNRSDEKVNVEMCKKIEVDAFNFQWVFKFKNRYGASVVKHFRFLWI